MDEINKKILTLLKKNARISFTEISRKVHLSAPAVAERVQKMEEQGVIKAYKTEVDYGKTGLPVQAFITFKTVSIQHKDFLKWIKTFPQIQECYIVTGNPGAFLKVAVDSTESLGLLIDKLKEYGETSTSVILSKPIDL
jgi:Lrp/AsnC family transcriptional regulator, leucine-responsive regulatory protein